MLEDSIKKMPFSMIAEQSLLGSILVDAASINEIADLIKPDDFYITEHKQIYLAATELFLASNEIDVVTLIDTLVRKGIYDKSGGEDYICSLADIVPSAHNIKDYAKIVKEKSSLRQLIEVCGDINEAALSQQESAAGILEYAESKIFAIAQGRDTKNFKHIRDVIGNVYNNLHDIAENGASTGTPTGFSGLDRVLVGMGDSDLILIGARPGMGKTSFALNIATNVAKQSKKKVCIFSLEMSAEQLVSRVLSSEALVDSHEIRSGKLSSDSWIKIAEASSALASCDILIDDTAGISITDMKAKLRRVDNLGLIVIDYLQLMQSDRRIDNRVQEVAEISRNLKLMAKELSVPIICCAQLSRGPESRTDKKPMLSDLRDSGAIEQDADVVIFLYRNEYYKTDATPGENNEGNIAEAIVAKNRHGSVGTVKMGWIGKYTKFRTIADENSIPSE